MPQKTAVGVTIGVGVVLVAALVLFAVARTHHEGTGHADGEHREHMHDSAAGEDGEMAEHQEHGEGHLAMPERHAELKPSGTVQDGVRVVKMVARRFEFDPSTVVVRQGEKVRLQVTSEDVTHGIGIEGYGVDIKLEPNKTEIITFTAGKPGRHHFHCSVYCGKGHADMHGELIVLESTE